MQQTTYILQKFSNSNVLLYFQLQVLPTISEQKQHKIVLAKHVQAMAILPTTIYFFISKRSSCFRMWPSALSVNCDSKIGMLEQIYLWTKRIRKMYHLSLWTNYVVICPAKIKVILLLIICLLILYTIIDNYLRSLQG